MAAALQENHTLTTLFLEGEYKKTHRVIAWNALCAGGCVTAYSDWCSMTLNAGNRIRAAGAAALGAALKENHTLTTLDVGGEHEI